MPIFDFYSSEQDDLDNPASSAEAIVPHATNPLPKPTRAIYVGTTGDLIVRLINDNNDTTFKAVPAGSIFPVRASHVRSTGTAADLVALY